MKFARWILRGISQIPCISLIALIVAGAPILGCSCSSSPKGANAKSRASDDHPMRFDPSSSPGHVTQLWSKKMPGLITDLNVAKNGSAVLVATVPDPDLEGSAPDAQVIRLDPSGQIVWKKSMPSKVKAQAISEDGSLAVVTTYLDQVMGLDAQGNQKWVIEGACKPILLSRSHRFLCYHDDDVEAGLAFEALDWDGKKIFSYPAKQDGLALKVSESEDNFALAMTQGQLVLFGSEFQVLFQKRLPGEILDLAVSAGGADPYIAVLYDSTKEGQRLALLDRKGKVLAEGSPAARMEQVEISPQGDAILAYGNGPGGQRVALYPNPLIQASSSPLASASAKPAGIVVAPVPVAKGSTTPVLKEKWLRGDARYADYSSSIIASRDLVILGFEDVSPDTRHSHLIAFDFDGLLKWNIPVPTEEGAYLYAEGYSEQRSLLGVGTDDAMLSVYQVSK